MQLFTRRIFHKDFNSQPHEEADELYFWIVGIIPYFNSQPHEEADDTAISFCCYWNISTHSLTKRLTMALRKNFTRLEFQLTASRRG